MLNAPGGKYQLWMWDTGRHDHRGQPYIRYDFIGPNRRSIFAGEDFAGSPMNAIDSDEAVAALLNFLTLRPGDTDRDYFDKYTADQTAFAESSDAEYLQNAASYRFDKEYRNEVRRENRRRR